MVKKKKKQKKIDFPSPFGNLSEETVHGLWAVVFFVLSVFFALAAFDWAGVVGTTTYGFFHTFLGIGYYLIPIVFGMLAITYTGSLREHMGIHRTFGSVLFFISALALIDLIFKSGGGIVGKMISNPLTSLFDKATGVILVALVLISVMIMFDFRISFSPLKKIAGIFRKKEIDPLGEDKMYEKDQDEEVPPLVLNPLKKREYFEEEAEESADDDENSEDENNDGEEDDESEVEDEVEVKEALSKKEVHAEDDGGFRILPSGDEYVPPPLKLLDKVKEKPDTGDVKASGNLIKRTFSNFGIDVVMDEVSIGPTVTRYALKPAEGVKLSRVTGLQSNLELALAASPIRIEAPIPGKALVGIEVPNTAIAKIGMASVLGDNKYKSSSIPLLLAMGQDVDGNPVYADLAKMPHCLIAGTTGSGKSVTMHAIINSLLFRNGPEQLRLLLVDPKRVELTSYDGIPHLLSPVITEAKKTILALNWAAKEMNRRYDVLKEHHVRDIDSYHSNILAPAKEEQAGGGIEQEDMPEAMPFIVIMIDELADIMLTYPRELESSIVRLAQMSRAVGIHLIISTQRPSVNVITGLIKANIPSRIALQVTNGIDSKTILDQTGAQNLVGKGDMLFMSSEMSKPKRIQSPYISEEEVKRIVKYLKKNHEDDLPSLVDFTAESNGDTLFAGSIGGDDEQDDELYEAARQTVVEAGKASTSYLQRKLRVGYARAARLMDILEDRGVIGPAEGSKPRDILNNGEDEMYEKDQDEEVPPLVLNPLKKREYFEEEAEESADDDENSEDENNDDSDDNLYTRR